jgi:hypothetical protein
MNASGNAPQLDQNGNLQGGGNLLVDNNILVTATPAGGAAAPTTNVCTGGVLGGPTWEGQPVPPLLSASCFSTPYENAAASLLGDNPDTTLIPNGAVTVDQAGGIAPIDISGLLQSGQQSVNISLDDEGGELTSSSLFLNTNCTQGGVTGPATVSGNTITSGSQGTGLTQGFNFDTGNGQEVGFLYDVSDANSQNTLTENTDGSIPQTVDVPVDPSTFQTGLVPQTSFATSNCLVHTGELLADEVTQACKLYTLTCSSTENNNQVGANCPVSAVDNEVVEDLFDGPAFSLRDIYTPYGVFHQGIGFLMASESWTSTSGGPCTFDPASGLSSLPCPQNLLDSFSGPGGFAGKGLTKNPNSTFISIYGVPEDLTTVLVAGAWPGNWVNTSTPKIYFYTQAPNFNKGASLLNGRTLKALPGVANYIPAPIKSLTYGISAANNVPMPVNEPITSDTILQSSANCAAAPFTARSVPNFVPPVQTLSMLADGQYFLHYYAQDCAGTQELKFTQAPNTGVWSTNFYTVPVNVDTTPPVVAGLALSPVATSYKLNSVVNATYSCTDSATGAGVVLCGTHLYGTGTTYSTPALSTRVNTSSTGTKSFTVYAVDGAGNTSSSTLKYVVTR